ncbi:MULTISPECIES: cbb3-type cytochrome c oxidase subunit II [Sphingobacterium]|uniref:Cytochrome-c oxidase n=1 Tax=Sphingobacterium cellulitidis TaxID=1768011 RepID=A0A8H9G1W0_9SPHI|nr:MULTISPECIES: cbb3-type cytochrome c oxidase subunit II [Sphingobacterium]MBA8987693.1 cytochrome c oxidase cbb3-type subunit 2 [Sphingobacterium soli]WFB64362.1 cbb3-type cytochrome c oxidase subunit II [Sphingobacterium sp. WM]GGE22273.1 cytochrome-c oxidase [Sphingobacterium soli]
MNFFDDHKKLFITATLFFVLLTVFVAILPALNNQLINAPLPDSEPLSEDAMAGKSLFIANGCVACHTQQVRNVDMDKVFGQRPSVAADYARNERMDLWRNTATLMGTERTGPDLADVGNRQPSKEWNLVHLYNPRIVVKESIMPAYPFLFESKSIPGKNDVVVNIPEEFAPSNGHKVIASKEALQLIAYLQSLKQVKLEADVPEFLYKRKAPADSNSGAANDELDGEALYVAHCQACHQADGNGLPGAFPPLKGSPVVTGDDLELYVDIIMNGYDSRPEYGVMAPVGVTAGFTEKEVAAIINYERTSWGNNGKKIKPEDIKQIVDFVKTQSN